MARHRAKMRSQRAREARLQKIRKTLKRGPAHSPPESTGPAERKGAAKRRLFVRRRRVKVDKYSLGGKLGNLRDRGYQNVPSAALASAMLGLPPTPATQTAVGTIRETLGLPATPLPTPSGLKQRRPKHPRRTTGGSSKKTPAECPVARALLDADPTGSGSRLGAAPPSVAQYLDVIHLPGPKEKKELQLAHSLLQQYCQQIGVTVESSVQDSGERNKFNAPVHVATVSVDIDGRRLTHSAPALSTTLATQLARRALLQALFPRCTSLAEVQQLLKAQQKENRKGREARGKRQREMFLMSLFPGCASLEDARARMKAGWPARQARRKRQHEETTAGAFEMVTEEAVEAPPAKRQRRMQTD